MNGGSLLLVAGLGVMALLARRAPAAVPVSTGGSAACTPLGSGGFAAEVSPGVAGETSWQVQYCAESRLAWLGLKRNQAYYWAPLFPLPVSAGEADWLLGDFRAQVAALAAGDRLVCLNGTEVAEVGQCA